VFLVCKYRLRSCASAIAQIAARIAIGDEANPFQRVVRAATGTFGVRIASTGLSFVISILLARLLGVEAYGIYSYVTAWVALLAVPTSFGLDRLLVRDIAVYRTRSEWSLLKGLVRWANRTAWLASLTVALLATAVLWGLDSSLNFGTSGALWIGLVTLPFVTLLDLRQAALQGLNHVVTALLPDFFIRPVSLILFLGCVYLFIGANLNAQWALSLNILAAMLALLIATVLLHERVPLPAKEASPTYQTKIWVRTAVPMMFISGMHVINHRVDTLILGALTDGAAVGIYTVANRGAQLILLIHTAANVALAPTIAGLYATGKMPQLQAVVTKTNRTLLPVSLFIALVLVLFSDFFLKLFGSDFLAGRLALSILAVGCVVNAAAGTVSLLLTMTGYERDAAMGIGTGVLVNVALNGALIPLWGVEGAAVATSTSMILRNLLMAFLVHKRLEINSMALGRSTLN
jgi:O-antigen/teichoic acid export membrane protein